METSEKLIVSAIVSILFVVIKLSTRKVSSKKQDDADVELKEDVKNSLFVFASTFLGMYVFNFYLSYQTSVKTPDVFVSQPEF